MIKVDLTMKPTMSNKGLQALICAYIDGVEIDRVIREFYVHTLIPKGMEVPKEPFCYEGTEMKGVGVMSDAGIKVIHQMQAWPAQEWTERYKPSLQSAMVAAINKAREEINEAA